MENTKTVKIVTLISIDSTYKWDQSYNTVLYINWKVLFVNIVSISLYYYKLSFYTIEFLFLIYDVSLLIFLFSYQFLGYNLYFVKTFNGVIIFTSFLKFLQMSYMFHISFYNLIYFDIT